MRGRREEYLKRCIIAMIYLAKDRTKKEKQSRMREREVGGIWNRKEKQGGPEWNEGRGVRRYMN